MKVAEVTELIRSARDATPISTWPGYDIRDVPFAIYDDQEVQYVGHPEPPTTRPNNLLAATSVAINGVETATIPAEICGDEEAAITLAYHEGFHVFQHYRFAPIEADMFMAMAFYPDLELDYRTLCRLEVEVLRRIGWLAEQRLGFLGHIASLRREKLTHHQSLLGYERFLERSEGTAIYVEQKAWKTLFDISPTLEPAGHGWLRFYRVGSAICWLLDETVSNWTERIEQGASPSDLTIERADDSANLELLNYDIIRNSESEALNAIKNQINNDLAKLEPTATMRIRYKTPGRVFRAFNPSTLVSLGDGRVLHRSFLKLLIPGRGTIAVDNLPVIDNVKDGELVFSAVPCHLHDGTLQAQTDEVQIEVEGVEEVAEKVFELKSE